jgi:hypothetical protein
VPGAAGSDLESDPDRDRCRIVGRNCRRHGDAGWTDGESRSSLVAVTIGPLAVQPAEQPLRMRFL